MSQNRYFFIRDRTHLPGRRGVVLGKKLGSGLYGEVYAIKEYDVDNDLPGYVNPQEITKRVAKRFTPNFIHFDKNNKPKTRSIKEIEEVAVLEYRKNKNIPHLKTKGLYQVGNDYYLIMKKMPGINFYDLNFDDFSSDEALCVAIAMANALKQQVQDLKLVHRDLHARNIMLDVNNPPYVNVNVIDYGYSKNESDNSGLELDGDYNSPELRAGNNCTIKNDIYSLGVSFIRLLLCDPRNQGDDHQFIAEGLNKRYSYTYFQDFTQTGCRDALKKLLENMLLSEPNDRPSIEEVLTQLHWIRRTLEADALNRDVSYFEQAAKAAKNALARLESPKNIQQMEQIIQDHLTTKDKIYVREFLQTLGMKSLSNFQSIAGVTREISDIKNNYNEKINYLKKVAAQIDGLRVENRSSLPIALKKCFETASRKLIKYDDAKYNSLDQFVYANESMDRCIAEIDRIMQMHGRSEAQQIEDMMCDKPGMPTLNDYRRAIKKAQLIDNKSMIGGFTLEMEGALFVGYETQAQLLERIDEIENDYFNSVKRLDDINANFAAFKEKYKNSKLFSDENLNDELENYFTRLKNNTSEFRKESFAWLDDYNEATSKINQEIQKFPSALEMLINLRCRKISERIGGLDLVSDLSSVLKDLKKRDKDEDPVLAQIKRIFKAAISEYLKETATNDNLLKGKRAASFRRIQDMRELIVIVRDAEDARQLKHDFKVRLNKINGGFLFFGGSALKDQGLQAVEMAKTLLTPLN